MLNPPKKLCKSCNKSPPHTGRRDCLQCIQKKEKDTAKAKRIKKETKIKVSKAKATTKKRFSRSRLIKEADRVWSLYIRHRDIGKPCITCGKAWEDTHQAGHFQSRRHLNTRWVARNGASQCVPCNNWGSGEQYEFSLALDDKYPGLPESLRKLAQNTEKTTDSEILDYIRTYYQLLEEMGVEYKPKKFYLHDNQ